MTPDCSHDIEIIEVEPQRKDNDEIEQGAVTQEPTSLNVLAHMAAQMRGGEPGIEGTLEFNEEFCTTTLDLSQDTEILELEPQQQGDEEVNQDVVTQEPTSLKIVVEMQQVDFISEMDLGEDKQVQSQPSGDTEILEE